ncbi:MAG: LLM class F420-dependent oxidoreductase [Acidimicrobiaceae bacterium]|nr:LLM class F420-dependent oxidoreductase [Acidimicrobiaceae bacterium]
MQFGIMFANTGFGSSPDGAKAVVQAAEAGGFSTAWTVEHVVVPSGYESKYPYDASGKMAGGAEDFDLPDPLIWLTWAAAHTTTLRLGTGILIATQRNPVVTAKAIATLDHLSGGRLDLGVGVGWLEEEFAALGVPFAARGRRLDEYIDAMRALWTEDKASYHGEFVDFTDCIMRPRPVNGTVPVVIGGHTEAAARRAGKRGDAFFPGSASTDELAHLIGVMKRAAEEAGRDGDAIAVYAGAGAKPGPKLDERVESLAEVGVAQAVLPTFPPDVLADVGRDLVARYG